MASNPSQLPLGLPNLTATTQHLTRSEFFALRKVS